MRLSDPRQICRGKSEWTESATADMMLEQTTSRPPVELLVRVGALLRHAILVLVRYRYVARV